MWFAFFILAMIGLGLVLWMLTEIYYWLFPQHRAANHWDGDIGFKAVDPDELFRRCEGDE